jgi:hypothetical protein
LLASLEASCLGVDPSTNRSRVCADNNSQPALQETSFETRRYQPLAPARKPKPPCIPLLQLCSRGGLVRLIVA